MNSLNNGLNISQIKEYLPHRYPLLLVDRVLGWESGKTITAIKNVSVNEPFFPGHFPHYHVMPGVLIVEAMAQAAAVLSLKSLGHHSSVIALCPANIPSSALLPRRRWESITPAI